MSLRCFFFTGNVMRVCIGSKNSVKVAAVEETLSSYPQFEAAQVVGVSTESGVSSQPKTLDETICGAKTRAENAFQDCDYSVGIEGGLMETDGEFMGISICSVFDGEHHHIGMSSGFRLPSGVIDAMIHEGLDMAKAMHHCGLSSSLRLGEGKGAVGVFTNGRVTRKDLCRQALTSALISVEEGAVFV